MVQPQIMTLVLNPLSWHHDGVGRFVLVKSRENKEDAELSHWRAGIPLAPQRWGFSSLENILSLLLLLLPLPFKLLAGVEVIFPVCPECFGIFLFMAQLGRGHSSWLWCDESCLPSSSLNTTTVPLWSASSPLSVSSQSSKIFSPCWCHFLGARSWWV